MRKTGLKLKLGVNLGIMNNRINILRELSLTAANTISPERALLITDFYKNHNRFDEAVSIQRAKAFRYILLNKEISIISDELIVGERGPAPKAVPTYPEVTLHSLKDLDILNSRDKVSYKVSQETRKIYEDEIIPYWKGKTQRERLMDALGKEWHEAYKAGIFTEFQEQRTPGHTVAGKKIYSTGINDMIKEIKRLKKNKKDEDGDLEAMEITAESIISFARRYSAELKKGLKPSQGNGGKMNF